MNLDHLDLLIAQGALQPKPVCVCVISQHVPRVILNAHNCPVPEHRKAAQK